MFGFSSYQLAEGLAHLQLTMSLCVPLAGWVIVRYANGRLTGKRFATRIAAIAVAQFLISPELLATMLLIGAITAAGAIALAPHARTEVRGTLISPARPSVTAPFKRAPDTCPSAPTSAVSTSPKASATASESGGGPAVVLPSAAAPAVAVPV